MPLIERKLQCEEAPSERVSCAPVDDAICSAHFGVVVPIPTRSAVEGLIACVSSVEVAHFDEPLSELDIVIGDEPITVNGEQDVLPEHVTLVVAIEETPAPPFDITSSPAVRLEVVLMP